MDTAIQMAFDYSALNPETRIVVQQEDKEFDRNMGDAGSSFIRACHNLLRIHDQLRYSRPGFVDYCQSKNGLGKATAYRMIDVARMFPETGNIPTSNKEALYLLAAPSTPESAREEAIERASAGEAITHSTARQIVADHRIPIIMDTPEGEHPTPEPEEPWWTDTGEIDVAAVQANPDAFVQDVVRTADRHGSDMVESTLSSVARALADILSDTPAEAAPLASHQLINASTNNEWYTPKPFLDAAHEVMGAIDLDPASNPLANQAVRATRYFTIHDDGLAQEWAGRLWLNPPYGRDDGKGNQAQWSRKLIDAYQAGDVTEAILLVNAVTGNGWFEPLKDYPICFPDRRIRFYNQSTEAGAPTHSNALVYFGPHLAHFVRVFSRFGAVMARLVEQEGRVAIQGVSHE